VIRVFVDDLMEGMVLASDLVTAKGRFILAEGATLQLNHLKILKSWGITEAEIVDDSYIENSEDKKKIDTDCLELAEKYLRQRFTGADLEHDMLAETFRHARQHLAQKLSEDFVLPELSDILPPKDVESDRISPAHLIRGEDQLASLPNVYTRIVETLNSPRASSAVIADIVSKDSSLSLRLLQLVNSAFYGFPAKIDSISRGITLLGTNEITTLSLGISVVRLFQDIPVDLINMETFWKHSIRCGLFAQVIASHKVGLSEEKLFIGGLLHDIGRLVMIRKIPKKYTRAILLSREEQIPLYRAEQKTLYCDHAEIGRMLANEWRLTPALTQMIGGHHSPAMDRYPIEACIVHIADFLAHACGDELLMTMQIPPLNIKAWETVGLSPSILGPTIQHVDRLFNDIIRVFLDKTPDAL
jgi:HD-like signal output (HDOD) protein